MVHFVQSEVSLPRNRADAARNGNAVLAAADELFNTADAWRSVSIETIAARAGVGKATVLRAYGDRAGLIHAIMARRSRALVEAVDGGPQPLGPGTPALQRVPAVLDAMLSWKLSNRQLSLALEQVAAANSPFQGETYQVWLELLISPLRELGVADANFSAHALLAAIRSDLLEHLLSEGYGQDDLHDQLGRLAARVIVVEGFPRLGQVR